MTVEKLLFSVAEVSKILGVSRPTVYNLIYSEQLKSKKIGHKIMIPKIVLETFINDISKAEDM